MSPSSAVTGIAIGVPARDEATRIGPCIESIDAAAAHVHVPVHLVVADDASEDGTAALARHAVAAARHLSGRVITRSCGTAGIARAAAINSALQAFGADDRVVWVATTDADSTVGPTWLANQVAWAARGAGAITGLVEIEWDADSRHLASRYAASVGEVGPGHRHVYGANFGLRSSHWVAVGGCGDGADGEDHELRRRLVAIGVDVLGVDDLPVLTSGRLHGRVAAGLSGYLRALLDATGPEETASEALGSGTASR